MDELDPAWHIKVRLTDIMPTSLHREELNAHRLPFLNLDYSVQSLWAYINRNVAPTHPAYTNPELAGSIWCVISESECLNSYDSDSQKACIVFEKAS